MKLHGFMTITASLKVMICVVRRKKKKPEVVFFSVSSFNARFDWLSRRLVANQLPPARGS